jgi:chemotaxis protein CheY-P-specific phosphatase CheC
MPSHEAAREDDQAYPVPLSEGEGVILFIFGKEQCHYIVRTISVGKRDC